jgi:uncharacterized repeat protein (TIGR02543 family)
MIVAVMTTALAGTAWSADQTITLDYNSFGLTNSYAKKTATVNGFSFTVDQGYKGSGNTIQMNSSKGSGILYNTTAIPGLKSIQINVASGNKTYTITTGTSEKPTANSQTGTTGGTYNATSGDTFFQLKVSGASYFSSIVITYDPSGVTPIPSLSVSPASIAFGEKAIHTTNTETFEVTFANLTQNLTVSGFTGVTVSPTTINKDDESPQTVTVTYAPTAEGSISGNVTVSNTGDAVSETVAVTGSAYDPANAPTYNLFTGALEEGDYIIYYEGYALKNTVTSNRLDYVIVSPSNDVITTLDASIIWHIAPNGNYWTIYNDAVGKYASSTGSKNQGALIEEVTDNAKWTVTGLSTYDFENLARSSSDSDPGNKWLRNNGTYGFACYASSTGGALSLYKLNDGNPSISADDVNINYDATSGSIAFTVTNPVDGGQVSVTTEANWLTPGSATSTSPISFTCTANEANTARTATVTLTYTYNTNETVTTTVTVTQAAAPVIYTTIPALFAAATSDSTPVTVTFGNWVVTGVNHNQVFVTDGTNGLIIYQSEHGFVVGNTLSGTVSCNLVLFNGSTELTGVAAATEGLTVGTGGTVTPVTTTIADLSAVNTGSVVTLNNLTYDGSVLSDGTNTIEFYTSLYDGTTLVNGITYNITGVFVLNNDTKRILPRSSADIENKAPKHIVSFSVNGVVTSSENISEGDAITFPANPADINGKTFVGWTTTEIGVPIDTPPAMVTSATMGTEDVTYYAVFATKTAGSQTITTDVLTRELTGISGTSYTEWSGKTATSMAVYAGQSAGSNEAIQLRSTNSNSGVISTTSGGTLKKVTVVWESHTATGRTLDVYGKNTAYSAATDLYSSSQGTKLGSIVCGTSTELTISGNYTYVGLRSNDGAMYLSSISIDWATGTPDTYSGYCTTPDPYEPETITLNDYGYASFASTSAVDFAGVEGYSAWAVTSVSDENVITFEPIGGAVAAGTGVILKGSKKATIYPVYVPSGNPFEGNLLVGIATDTDVVYGDYYGLKGNNFVRVATSTVPAGKALLPANLITETETTAKVFTFVFEDNATGIRTIETVSAEEAAQIFDLSGRRLSKTQKGINIVNGKKVLK